jgi:hypothetical protein
VKVNISFWTTISEPSPAVLANSLASSKIGVRTSE